MTKKSNSDKSTPSAPSAVPYRSRAEVVKQRIAKLPADRRATVETLKLVRAHYITSGRDRNLREKFQFFIDEVFSSDDALSGEGRIFFITGRSGAGKSRAIRHLLQNTDELAPEETPYGVVTPVVSVSLKGSCTVSLLGEMILRASGYPILATDGAGKLWNSLPERLGHRQVLLVHIDETQHLIKNTEKAADRKKLAEALKGAMNDAYWPISFIVSGLPDVNDLAGEDIQFERRGYFERIPRVEISDPEQRQLVLKIIREMTDKAGLKSARLIDSDMPDRIAHAAGYAYGRITQIVLAGIHQALRNNARELTPDHLEDAYVLHSHARGRIDDNPFTADNWMHLPEGSFLIKDEDGAERDEAV